MKNNYYIYTLIDKTTGIPFYVGKGKGNRVLQHFLRAIDKPDSLLHETIRAYIADSCMPIIDIEMCESEEEAFIREIHAIARIGRKDLGLGPLLNTIDGGAGVFNLSDDIRKRISSNLKGYKHSSTTIAKMRIAAKERWIKRKQKTINSITNQGP